MKERRASSRNRRRDMLKSHLIQERSHDPCGDAKGTKKTRVCPQCGAVFKGGRWEWAKVSPAEAERALCAACCRLNDDYPAGELVLGGSFLNAHKGEILGLVRNEELAEKTNTRYNESCP